MSDEVKVLGIDYAHMPCPTCGKPMSQSMSKRIECQMGEVNELCPICGCSVPASKAHAKHKVTREQYELVKDFFRQTMHSVSEGQAKDEIWIDAIAYQTLSALNCEVDNA